jgi:hypothetical protein
LATSEIAKALTPSPPPKKKIAKIRPIFFHPNFILRFAGNQIVLITISGDFMPISGKKYWRFLKNTLL